MATYCLNHFFASSSAFQYAYNKEQKGFTWDVKWQIIFLSHLIVLTDSHLNRNILEGSLATWIVDGDLGNLGFIHWSNSLAKSLAALHLSESSLLCNIIWYEKKIMLNSLINENVVFFKVCLIPHVALRHLCNVSVMSGFARGLVIMLWSGDVVLFFPFNCG